MIRVSIQAAPFDEGDELATLRVNGVGGIASFTGIVRGTDGLTELHLDHYPGMTEAAVAALAEMATKRWALDGATLIHRIGPLHPGDLIVFVGAASAHRAAALEACAFMIDRLKTDAPFWKRETFADGRSIWIDARDSDTAAAWRWNA